MAEESAIATPETGRRRLPRVLEHLLLGGLVCGVTLVRLFPRRLGFRLARTAGRLIYLLRGPDCMEVRRNLRIAFGAELDEGRIMELARKFWIHFCQGIVEGIRMTRWTLPDLERWVDLTERPRLEELRSRGCGVIVVSAHLGLWEAGACALGLMGYPTHILVNPGTIGPIFDYLRRQRERSGLRVHTTGESLLALKRLLDNGAWLCVLADLNAGRRGVFVPFFGVQASSYLAPAALQRFTGCPILVGSVGREPDGRFRLRIWEVLEREKSDDRDADLVKTTKRIHAALEKAIRFYPEQWLWNYRRWRSRPPGEIPGPDGLPPRVAEDAERTN
jgi:KDO2-lipid IV(A) lauroyltransferase